MSKTLYGRVYEVPQEGNHVKHYKCIVSAGKRFGFTIQSKAYDSSYYAACKLALGMREEGLNATIVVNDLTVKPPMTIVFEADVEIKDEDGGEWWNDVQ